MERETERTNGFFDDGRNGQDQSVRVGGQGGIDVDFDQPHFHLFVDHEIVAVETETTDTTFQPHSNTFDDVQHDPLDDFLQRRSVDPSPLIEQRETYGKDVEDPILFDRRVLRGDGLVDVVTRTNEWKSDEGEGEMCPT